MFLPGDFGELGFGLAGAEGTDANTVRLQFFGEAFGEEEVEGFRGGVGRDVRNALKGGGGCDDQYAAVAARDHFGDVKARQMDDRGAIYLDHVREFARFDGLQLAVGTEACVVDQQLDFDALVFRELEYFFGRVGLREVSNEDSCLDFVGGFQLFG